MTRKVLAVVVLVSSTFLAFCAIRRSRDYVFSVTGAVVADEDGSPVQDAEVTLDVDSPVYQAITPVKTAKALTNRTGNFIFMYLTDKRGMEYTVTVRKEGFLPQTISGSAPPAGDHAIRLKKAGQ